MSQLPAFKILRRNYYSVTPGRAAVKKSLDYKSKPGKPVLDRMRAYVRFVDLVRSKCTKHRMELACLAKNGERHEGIRGTGAEGHLLLYQAE